MCTFSPVWRLSSESLLAGPPNARPNGEERARTGLAAQCDVDADGYPVTLIQLGKTHIALATIDSCNLFGRDTIVACGTTSTPTGDRNSTNNPFAPLRKCFRAGVIGRVVAQE
jgi:hypothetical protein